LANVVWRTEKPQVVSVYIGATEIFLRLAGESTNMNSTLNGASAKKKRSSGDAPLIVPPEAGMAATPESIRWTQTAQESSERLRHDRIAIAAYLIAEARGFEPGHEADDWLHAQSQIDAIDSAAAMGV
jgi:hypothetical protein